MPVPDRARQRASLGKTLFAAACAFGLMLAVAGDAALAHKRHGGGGDHKGGGDKKPPFHWTGDDRKPIPPVAQPPKPPVARPTNVRDHRTAPGIVRDHRARGVARAVVRGIPRAVARDERVSMPVERIRPVNSAAGGVRVSTSATPRKTASCGTTCQARRTAAGVGRTVKNTGKAIVRKVDDIF